MISLGQPHHQCGQIYSKKKWRQKYARSLCSIAVRCTDQTPGAEITVSMGTSTQRPTSYPPNVIYFSHDQETFHVDSTATSEWGAGEAIYLMVAVKDTGIGISEPGQIKLFERFRYATWILAPRIFTDCRSQTSNPKDSGEIRWLWAWPIYITQM